MWLKEMETMCTMCALVDVRNVRTGTRIRYQHCILWRQTWYTEGYYKNSTRNQTGQLQLTAAKTTHRFLWLQSNLSRLICLVGERHKDVQKWAIGNKKNTTKSFTKSSSSSSSRPSHQLLVVEREAQALQHGDEDDDVLLVGGQGAEHGGQFAEALLQRVDVQHHPAHPTLRDHSIYSKPYSKATAI